MLTFAYSLGTVFGTKFMQNRLLKKNSKLNELLELQFDTYIEWNIKLPFYKIFSVYLETTESFDFSQNLVYKSFEDSLQICNRGKPGSYSI